MELNYAFCAKYGEVGPDGLFAVIGGGPVSVNPGQLPGIIPALSLVMHITVPEGEIQGGQRLRIELFGPDELRLPVEVEIVVPPINRPEAEVGQGGSFSSALSIASLGIPMAGHYEFRISVDGRRLGTVPLNVMRPAEAPGG